IATIYLIYKICTNFASKKVAILTSIIYSLSPLLIIQSKTASNPHMIPFFSASAIFSAMRILKQNKFGLIWPIVCGVSLGIIFQLHYIGISLIIAIFLIISLNRKLMSLIFVTLSLILSVGPQIIFELRHNFFITHL